MGVRPNWNLQAASGDLPPGLQIASIPALGIEQQDIGNRSGVGTLIGLARVPGFCLTLWDSVVYHGASTFGESKCKSAKMIAKG